MNICLLRIGMLVRGVLIFSLFSSHCPHLNADASRDFSSGSSVLLSTLQSLPSAPPSAPSSVAFPSVSLPLPRAQARVATNFASRSAFNFAPEQIPN